MPLIADIRSALNGIWQSALNDVPYMANPNLRPTFQVGLEMRGADTTLLGPGYSVTATLNSAQDVSGNITEVQTLQARSSMTDVNSLVYFTFTLTLDVSQTYQVDVNVIAPDGTSQEVQQAVLLNPQPGSDWGNVGQFIHPVQTDLAGAAPGTSASSYAVTVLVGVYDANGRPVQGATVTYYLVEANPVTGIPAKDAASITVASGTADASGSFVKKVTITIVPADNYQRQVEVDGTVYIVGGEGSATPGHAIISNGTLTATVAGSTASA